MLSFAGLPAAANRSHWPNRNSPEEVAGTCQKESIKATGAIHQIRMSGGCANGV